MSIETLENNSMRRRGVENDNESLRDKKKLKRLDREVGEIGAQGKEE